MLKKHKKFLINNYIIITVTQANNNNEWNSIVLLNVHGSLNNIRHGYHDGLVIKKCARQFTN